MGGNANKKLVQDTAKDKNAHTSALRGPASSNQGTVHMSPQEVIYWLVPGTPVGAYARTIPPLRVELFGATWSAEGRCTPYNWENIWSKANVNDSTKRRALQLQPAGNQN